MKEIIMTMGLSCVLMASQAQLDTYCAPTGNLMTFSGAQMAIFGNVINDARGVASSASTSQTGVNHAGGGTVYLYRRAIHGSGNSRIYDGPMTIYGTGSNNYNAGGKAVRFYNLITDNNVGTSSAHGTNLVNISNGSGQIQIEQEVCVSNLLTFVNGKIWTPRASWKHAYLHFDQNGATYTGAGAMNTAFASPATNLQVDGYVAKSGNENFTFPIGDGIYTRFSRLSGPENGTFKSAFFHYDGHTLTTSSGISGSSTQGSTADVDANGGTKKVNTTEFWDIDGTAKSNYSLDAFHTINYSNWGPDFSGVASATPGKIIITALDAWENLGIATAPSTYTDNGTFTTGVSTNPDAGATGMISPGFNPASGNPFVAYTWAIAPIVSSPLPITLLDFGGTGNNCLASLSWKTLTEANSDKFILEQSENGVDFLPIVEVNAAGSSSSLRQYGTTVTQKANICYYRLRMLDKDGTFVYSTIIRVSTNCAGEIFQVFPNPVSKNDLNIQLTSSIQGKVKVIFTNVLGQQFLNSTQSIVFGFNNISVPLKNLANGTYFISLFDETGQKVGSTQKVVLMRH